MNQDADEQIKKNAVMDFVSSYGLLGFMTALSTTPEFITYEAVYLPKNRFIKEESMTTEQYLSYFFPFDKLDFVKRGVESTWSVSEPTMAALVMTMSERPQAVTMSLLKEYAEPYEWLLKEFTDWAFTFLSGFLYYQDFDKLDDMQKDLYRQGMATFGCGKVFLASRPNTVFCSGQCKNQYNVYKSRGKSRKENLPDGE